MIKNNKGITLVSLVIIIVVMLIIAGMTLNVSFDRFEINNFKKMLSDLELLENKVSNYYLKYSILPVGEKYNNELNFEKNSGDDNEYYIINLTALENGVALNYGKEGYKKQNESDDVYIINKKTHSIYYVKGVKMKGKVYHSILDNSDIASTIPPSKPEIKIISGTTNDNEEFYTTEVILEIIPGKDHISGQTETTCRIKSEYPNEEVKEELIDLNSVNNIVTLTNNGIHTVEVECKNSIRGSAKSEKTIIIKRVIKSDAEKQVKNESKLELEMSGNEQIIDFKIYGGNKNKIPQEYQPIKYIESDGNQYINTGYYPSSNTNAKYKVSISQYATEGPHLLSSETYYFPFWSSDNCLTAKRGAEAFEFENVINEKNKEYEIEAYWDGKIFINGEEKGELTSIGNKDGTTQLVLGSYGKSPRTEAYALKGKIYYCEIYDSNNLIKDFMPCIQKSDNSVGMYETVKGRFYTSGGTKPYIAGDEIVLGIGDYDANTNKYKISIKITDNNENSIVKDIYLSEPLYKGEYIDCISGKVFGSENVEKETIDVPEMYTYNGNTTIEILTKNKPSQIDIKYRKYTY